MKIKDPKLVLAEELFLRLWPEDRNMPIKVMHDHSDFKTIFAIIEEAFEEGRKTKD